MKKAILFFMAISLSFAACSADKAIRSETPQNATFRNYRVIHLGWINYPVSEWKTYGYTSQAKWTEMISDLNLKSLPQYLKDFLPGKTVVQAAPGSSAMPAAGDLFIKFSFKNIERNFNAATGGFDYLDVLAEFYDIRTRKKLYTADLHCSSARSFPHNWKAQNFDGRLDNQIYNLAATIARKL